MCVYVHILCIYMYDVDVGELGKVRNTEQCTSITGAVAALSAISWTLDGFYTGLCANMGLIIAA